MKTSEDFKNFYDTVLIPDTKKLESIRNKIIYSFILVGFLLLMLVTLTLVDLNNMYLLIKYRHLFIIISIIILLSITILYLVVKFYYVIKFKQLIINKIINFIDENLNYSSNKYIDYCTFMKSRLLLSVPNTYSGSDLVYGKALDTNISFSQLYAAYKLKKHTITLFKGVFFTADFNKTFNGQIFVLPDAQEKMLGHMASFIQSLDSSMGELVKLENLEFEKQFVVYADDQITARYVLSTSLMEKITDLKDNIGIDIYMSFINSALYIAIPCSNNIFNPKILKTLLNYEIIEQYFLNLQLLVGIIEDLNLNNNV